MAFDRIPMPQTGMDSFLKGLTTSQSIFNSMMDNRLNPYKQQLMSAQAQQAQATANESKMWAQLINQAGGLSGIVNNQTPTSPTTPTQTPDSTSTQTAGSTLPTSTLPTTPTPTVTGGQNAATMTRSQLVGQANQDQANADQNTNLQTNATQTPVVTQPPSNTQQAPQPIPSSSAPAIQNIGRSLLAAKMGLQRSPAVVVNGKIVQFDPLTNQPIQTTQVGETSAQTRTGETQQKGIQQQNETDIKANTSDINTAQALNNTIQHLKDISNVVYNPANKNLTGLVYALPGGETAAKNSTNNTMGTFIAATGELQADAAKTEAAGNGRGAGIGLVKFFQAIKPDIKNSMNVNQGMTSQLINDMASRWDNSKQAWETRNPGKTFPVPRPDFENIVNNATAQYAPNSGNQQNVNNSGSNAEGVIQNIKTIGNQQFHQINGKWYPYLGR